MTGKTRTSAREHPDGPDAAPQRPAAAGDGLRDFEVPPEARSLLARSASEIVWHNHVENGESRRFGWVEFTGREIGVDEAAWHDFIHPEDRTRALAEILSATEAQRAYMVAYRLRHRSGTWRWVEDHAVPIFGPAGAVTHWTGVVTDVQARRDAEETSRLSEQHLRVAVEATGLATWAVDLDGGRRDWSFELKAMLGLAPDCVPSEELLLSVVHPDDRAAVRAFNHAAAAPGDGVEITFRIRHGASGETRWIQSRGRVVSVGERAAQRIGTFMDVTEQVRIRAELRAALKRYQALIEATSEIVWHANADQSEGDGTGWQEFTGQSAEEANGNGWLMSVHPDDRPRAETVVRTAVAAGRPYTNEYRLRHVSGTYRWVIDRVVPLHDDQGRLIEWVGIIADVHEKRLAAEQIWRAAHEDHLTGIANRARFQSALERAFQALGPEGAVGVVLVDLDRFKEINDGFGHDAGDHVLRVVAERLQACAPPAATVARLGGDEFGLVVPGCDADTLAAAADRLLAAIRCPIVFAGRELDCSVTVGTALTGEAGYRPEHLLKDADLALYTAKSAGRSKAVPFHPSMRDGLERRQAQLRAARAALAEGRLVPFYQPKLGLADGTIVGFEALLRIRTGAGLAGPAAIAEALDDPELSQRIGETMLAQVCADMARWRREGIAFGHVAVNVAGPELEGAAFAGRVLSTIEGHGLAPSDVEIEVTEGALLDVGHAGALDALSPLERAGLRVTLDDFGTGYASLTHLKSYPVSCLKIDRGFVSNLEHEPESAAIVQAVLAMAQQLGIVVVAEGIETRWQLQTLRELHCDMGQGFYIAKPMAASRLPRFLAGWRSPFAEPSRKTAANGRR